MRYEVFNFSPNWFFSTGVEDKDESSTSQIFAHALFYYQEKSSLCRLPLQMFISLF